MPKKILSIGGLEIPGGEVERIQFHSRRSLLDADIVIFSPGFPPDYSSTTYQGKTCLSDDSSFRTREALAHWRRELMATIEAEKLVIVLMQAPQIVFAATGDKQHSGTGRNARVTRIVEQLHSYSAIPAKWNYHEASGVEMTLTAEARFLAPYWTEFSEYSKYETFIDGDVKEPLVKTKSGNRIVGACGRKGRGALLALPALQLNHSSFFRLRSADNKKEEVWTKEGAIFGKKLLSCVVSLQEALVAETAHTPTPQWTKSDVFRLSDESTIQRSIETTTTKIEQLESQRIEYEAQLKTAGELRYLLYEQGKPLEKSVLQALQLFGFDAKGFKEDGSEFDAVFSSAEGRFIGEVEGKDNKAINIDKFSQLERNLNEDFARDGVEQFAKGVLFGNAFRLQPPPERENPFTEKCRTAAKRLGVALVRTEDLFAPSRYMKDKRDDEYGKRCREAIFATSGDIVTFPAPPDAISSEMQVTIEVTEPPKTEWQISDESQISTPSPSSTGPS